MTQDSEQTLKENKVNNSSSSRRSNSSSTKTSNHSSTHSGSNKTEKRDKTRDGLQTRVVIRHLPPTMTSEQFLEEISPIPEHNDYYFVRADTSLGLFSFSRAYINFIHMEDVFIFKDKFDNYVFVDSKGNEFPAIVEFAPLQKIPRRRIGANGQPITAKKRDNKCGTIEQDSDYITFLEDLEKDKNESNMPSAEVYLEEIEAREKELKANHGVLKITTPLIEFIKNKKAEKIKLREERREERRKQQLEQKRIREEEQQRKIKLKKQSEDKKHKESDEQFKEKSHKRDEEKFKIKNRDSDKKEVFKSQEFSKKSESKKNEKKSSFSNRYKNEKVKDTNNSNTNDKNDSTFVVKVLQNPDKDKDKTQESNPKNSSDTKKSEMNAEKSNTQDMKEVSNELKNNSEKTESSSKNSNESSRRIRNKDRPTREIYRPGAVKRNTSESSQTQANDSQSSGSHKSTTNRSEHGYKNRVFTRSKP
jgi:regulator of nonsense transcripts 3